MTLQLLNRALKKASKSTCKSQVAALGFNKKGELVHIASNTSRFSRKFGGVHAEMKVFRVAKRKNINRIVIIRVGGSKNILPIDPCEKCQKIAKKLNIKIETVFGRDHC